ncbi:hypothetical protein NEISICOT_02180 [Neisseria sicca ATCC 29256]|uniref:Uncharacterized protein n=1 Tax=Neisseria sicca ATCC 29256 TaxID=547045 RepID=C6M6M8_NEISI|nr:hypothetical protein NEISICOT_02180 [Neisseria sicca ATCC 29256]
MSFIYQEIRVCFYLQLRKRNKRLRAVKTVFIVYMYSFIENKNFLVRFLDVRQIRQNMLNYVPLVV